MFPRISVDGIGEKQSYQRTGLKWDKFEYNMLSFLEKFNKSTHGIKKIRANIALNVLNLVYCDEIVKYMDSVGYGDIEPHYNYIVKPEMFYMRHWGNKLNDAIDIINKQDFLGHTQYKEHITKMAGSFTNLESIGILEILKNGLTNTMLNMGLNLINCLNLTGTCLMECKLSNNGLYPTKTELYRQTVTLNPTDKDRLTVDNILKLNQYRINAIKDLHNNKN